MAEGGGASGGGGVKQRPVSTTSSQLSISDRMTDGDEEDNSSYRSNLLALASSSNSSLNLNRHSKDISALLMAKTTTISTIAMESNTSTTSKCSPTRLVIALLQTPHRGLQLKVIELSPALLKLPDNLIDAEDFLKNHNQVIKNLQSKQSPVEELLRQADNLIATQKPRAEVYAAMADSLGLTWKDLNGILEERKFVIQLAYNAHKNISECLEKMDKVHAEYSRISYMEIEEVKSANEILESLKKLKQDRGEILKGVSACLESCDKLLHKIAEYNYTIDSRDLVLVKDVEYANRQVHRWLERLHDRRVILEDKLKNKREQLEEYSETSHFDREIKQLQEELWRFRNFSQNFDFGDCVSVCERKREELADVIRQLKAVQEKSLLTTKRLEDAEYQRAKYYMRSGLKNKIYEILGETNDLLTESIDFDLSLADAKDFFSLADTAEEKLDSLSKSTLVINKSELNRLTFDALSKGEVILDTYGWDSNKTKGVRFVHDNLLKKKDDLLEEIEHLEVLDEYNHFLENINQAYQNILNIETSTLRQPVSVPVELEAVRRFKSFHESNIDEVSAKLVLSEIMAKLEEIYPNLSEEEKCGTEGKINELKALSNVILELLIQRLHLTTQWVQILEIYETKVPSSVTTPEQRAKLEPLLEEITQIYGAIQEQLNEVHHTDADLITTKMEERAEEIIQELREKLQSSLVHQRIREICQKYKVKLDHHLFGEPRAESTRFAQDGQTAPTSSPQYYPVLNESQVAQCLQSIKLTSAALNHILRNQLENKLDSTLTHFFQPLVTNFRQEILEVQEETLRGGGGGREKFPEEVDVERYCDRLKESYVTVTKEIGNYLKDLAEICQQVENRVIEKEIPEGVEALQKDLKELEDFQVEISEKIWKEIIPRLEKVLDTVGHEEPPIEAQKEAKVLRMMTSNMRKETLEAPFQVKQDALTKQLTERLIQSDLNLISGQLQELIEELNHPCNYGDNLTDAQGNLANFERFEKTVELLRQKLTQMLSTSGIPVTDEKAKLVKSQLEELTERRKRRKELILLSLEYFRLIQLSKEHYVKVNEELEGIRDASKNEEISIQTIEDLLKQLRGIKEKELEQEKRLSEIERISEIIFADVKEPTEQSTQHEPLREKNSFMTGELHRVESDLTELLGFIKSRSESSSEVKPTPVEIQTSIQIKEIPKEIEEMETLIIPQEAVVLRKAKGHEIQTQTSIPDDSVVTKELTKTELMERELRTLSVMETLRQTLSPLPPQTVEKETQFEIEEVVERPKKVDRDTVTQTIEDRNSTIETQTEGIQVLSTATETIEDISEMVLPLRPASREYQDPMFVQPLKDLVVNEGDRVVLECRTKGQVKRLLWLKDGMEIQNNPDYRTEFVEEETARLTIDEVFHEDSAIFTCRAVGGRNDSVTVETSGRLNVREPVTSLMEPPKFVAHPPVSSGYHGRPHTIQIKVEGNPLPTVQWFKNGQCIDTSPDYIITFNNGLCEIQFDELLKDLDEGMYACVAINKMGEAQTQIQLEVKGDATPMKKILRQPPKITKPLPKNLMSRAGQKLRLECEFESPTECSVVWWKDNSYLLNSNNSAAELKVTGNTASLTFNEAYPANTGKYTVLIKNASKETVQSDCHVIVKGLLPVETSDSEMNVSDMEIVKPFVKMPLQNVHVSVGDSVRLDCVIVGHPEPEVIWFKNGSPLKESPNHHLLFQGDRCSLIIKKVDTIDDGTYSVRAINNGGDAHSVCGVFVHDKEERVEDTEKRVEPPKFTKIIQDDMVTAGNECAFVVELEPSEPGDDTSLTWWKNNKKVEASEGIELIKFGTNSYALRIKECKLNDRGNYMAKASNSGGDTKCFACLIVKENLEMNQKSSGDQKTEVVTPLEQPRKLSITKLAMKGPRFVSPLEGRMVNEGDLNVSFKCTVDANPPAELRWTKNNSTDALTTSPRSNLTQLCSEKGGDVELIIKKVSIADGGRYTCTASNEFGVASSVADLVVKKTTFPPVFSKRLQPVTVEEGRRLYLEVDVFGKPAPEIIWELNGRRLGDGLDPEFTFKSDSPTRHSLAVPEAISLKHGGEYKVTARNEVGEASVSCSVNILKKPKSPFKEVEAIRVPPPVPPKPTTPIQNDVVPLVRSYGTTQIPIVTPEALTISSQQGQNRSIYEKVEEQNIVEEKTITHTTFTKQEFLTSESRLSKSTTGYSVPLAVEDYKILPIQPISTPVKMPEGTETTPAKMLQGTETTPAKMLQGTETIPAKMPQGTEGLLLEPGPEPEILIAPSPTSWKQSKNQVLEKVKTFEVRSETPDVVVPPSGGVRIIPSKEQPQFTTPTPTSSFKPEEQKVVNIPILPLEPFPFTLPEMMPPAPIFEQMQLPPSAVLAEPPKRTHDSTSSTERSEEKTDNGHIWTEQTSHSQQSSAEFKFIKPSKFVPEKMRESDYESDFETAPIPSKWTPSSQPFSTSVPTSSAFVPATSAQVPFVPVSSVVSSSTFTSQQEAVSYFKKVEEEERQAATYKPRLPFAEQSQQQPAQPGYGVKGIIKTWPPQEMASSAPVPPPKPSEEKRFLSTPSQGLSGSRLSPVSIQVPERSRSPTPNREALEMDKLWSKPIRFVSPSKLATSPVPSPQSSPRIPQPILKPSAPVVQFKPEVPPKPQQKAPSPSPWSPGPYTPTASPIPPHTVHQIPIYQTGAPASSRPAVPPKPASSYMSPKSPSEKAKDPLYYVSVVSTPRTTPIPSAMSPPPLPDVSSDQTSSFQDKREFFEQSSSSFSTTEETSSSSFFQQTSSSSSTSKSFFQQQGPSSLPTVSLLDQSFLPPPGEPPEFLYAPPPTSQMRSASGLSPRPQMTTGGSQPGQVISSSIMSSSSSSSSMMKKTMTSSSTEKPQQCSDAGALSSAEQVKKPKIAPKPESAKRPQPEIIKRPQPEIIKRPQSQLQEQVTSITDETASMETTRASLSKAVVPYRKPSKFTPKLDYASSLEKGYSSDQDGDPIRPKWNPSLGSDEKVRMTTWKRVQYEPPPESVVQPRRNSLVSYVDKRMQDLNMMFKDNISHSSQGLCYNKMNRKVQSDLDPEASAGSGDKESVEANPLIYFKYDFGYEFGIADPRSVIRSTSEPPRDGQRALPSSHPDTNEGEYGTIHLPIIHVKSQK